jgi:ABC-type Zn uptake system ZnuABC Zn-binding protein ZnuA
VLKHLENLDKADELLQSAKVRKNALMDTKGENFDSWLEKFEEADSRGI